MSATVEAKRLLFRAAWALRAASIRLEASATALSAAARSLAICLRTLENSAALCATIALTLLFAIWRNFLSWDAAWAASLERPFLASSSMLAILWSKLSMALSRASRAFLAFSAMVTALV